MSEDTINIGIERKIQSYVANAGNSELIKCSDCGKNCQKVQVVSGQLLFEPDTNFERKIGDVFIIGKYCDTCINSIVKSKALLITPSPASHSSAQE
jgi:hypothetical protein